MEIYVALMFLQNVGRLRWLEILNIGLQRKLILCVVYVVGSMVVHWLHACTFDNNSKARTEARRKGMCSVFACKVCRPIRGDHVCVCVQIKSSVLQEHNYSKSVLFAFMC